MPKAHINFRKNARTILRFAGQAEMFFWLLIWLMVLLVAGTISEKYLGLYQSQRFVFLVCRYMDRWHYSRAWRLDDFNADFHQSAR